MGSKIATYMKKHGSEVAGWGTLAAFVIGACIWIGVLQQRVASAEDGLKSLKASVENVSTVDETRVVRIHDRLESFSTKLDAFTKEQRDHLLADAEKYREITIQLKDVVHELKAIHADIKRTPKE